MRPPNFIPNLNGNKFIKYIVIAICAIVILHSLYEESSLFYRKGISLPFTMHLNKKDLYLFKGEEFHLYVFGLNKNVTFTTTDFRVVNVNFNGWLHAYQTGKAFIVAKVGDKKLTCRVHVIDINLDKITLKAGESYHLKIKGTGSFVRWKSNDKSIAKVSFFGKATAVYRGTAIITGKVKGKTVECTVIVE